MAVPKEKRRRPSVTCVARTTPWPCRPITNAPIAVNRGVRIMFAAPVAIMATVKW